MKRIYGYGKRKLNPTGRRFQGKPGESQPAEAGVATLEAPAMEDEELEISSRAATELGIEDPAVKLMGKAPEELVEDKDEEPVIATKPVATPKVEEKPVSKYSKKTAVKKTETKKSEPELTGELPDHLTGFMDTDNLQPTISATTPEEADPEAE